MQRIKNRLINLGVIGTFVMGGLVACNNGTDDNSSGRQPSTDTGVANSNVAPANPAATNTPAASSTSPAKKRKTSVIMPDNNSTGKMVKDNEGVYNNAQVMPQFPGGQNGLDSYVNDHIDYPQQAIDDNTSGTVRVAFVIDENGKVTKARLVGKEKLGNGLDEQALKVVNQMPAWKPGKVNGKNVKIRLELPISFQVEA